MTEFFLIFREPTLLDECNLDEKTKEVLLSNIKRKLTSQAVKIRADIECACYGYEGIDAVKTALRAGLEQSTEELPIKINLIAPPLYGESSFPYFKIKILIKFLILSVMTTSTPEKTDGLKALENAIVKIEQTITKLGGVFQIKMAVSIKVSITSNFYPNIFPKFQPKVVTAVDEADLARRLERAEIENAEVDGDDDEEDENEEGMTYEEGNNNNISFILPFGLKFNIFAFLFLKETPKTAKKMM